MRLGVVVWMPRHVSSDNIEEGLSVGIPAGHGLQGSAINFSFLAGPNNVLDIESFAPLLQDSISSFTIAG